MSRGKYVEIWENLKEENRKLLFVIGFLVIIIVFLLMAVVNLAVHRNISLYIPGVPVEIKAPSKELGLWWARYYVNLLGNFIPEIVEDNYQVVYSTATPEAKDKILKEINKIKKNKISQSFLPIEGSWEFSSGGIIKINGFLKRYIGSDLVEEKTKKMCVKLRWNNGKFELEDWWYE